MLKTVEEVIAALKRYREAFDPKTTSIIMCRKDGFDPLVEPFRAGFLSRIEEREELQRRMRMALTERERTLLWLWYIVDLPICRIAREVDISRRHCYRLRDKALSSLVNEADGDHTPRRDGRFAPTYNITSVSIGRRADAVV